MWGRQFERLIRVVKKAIYKVIAGGSLFWNELTNTLLNMETQVIQHLLYYVEDDPDLPILTPATFLKSRPGTSQTRTYADKHDSF